MRKEIGKNRRGQERVGENRGEQEWAGEDREKRREQKRRGENGWETKVQSERYRSEGHDEGERKARAVKMHVWWRVGLDVLGAASCGLLAGLAGFAR